MRLWDVKHKYYCNHGNYYARGNEQPATRYRSFSEFMEEEGDCDSDYNLLFRWDWKEGDDEDLPPFNGDVNYRNGLLCLYWIGQRKGKYRWSEVEVCRADEAAVIDFLKPKLAHLLGLWSPLSNNTTPSPREAAE